jgi:preprotein translocase subunit SecF
MNWMKYKFVYFFLSILVLIPGVVSLAKWGLRPSIDFTGGTLMELKFNQLPPEEFDPQTVEEIINSAGFEVASAQASGDRMVLVRMKPIDREEAEQVRAVLAEKLGDAPEEIRLETVGPTLGKELLNKTLVAIFLAAGTILVYIAWQFKEKKFGICAILAMFHDSLILLGAYSLLGHFYQVEVDTLFVTAVLTILSFSVHDTVVVYDRIRESQKNYPRLSFKQLVNKAVTETLARSLNNSLTIIFMLVALLLLGGQSIFWFTMALLIGTIAGTYSSTFTAAPLLLVWDQLFKRKQ